MQNKIVFHNAVQRLKQAGIPEPELEVSLLLSHALGIDRTALLLAGERPLPDTQIDRFEKYLTRRLNREPLAYITGEKEFWSLDFKVSQDVLIPRPETEFLLDKTLEILKRPSGVPGRPVRILDLGTGSGIIAIILALELQKAEVTAVDRSYRALKVARHNATRHRVAGKINFINCNWFAGIGTTAGFDAVITNPPYIAREVLDKPFGRTNEVLQPEVGQFEPHLALDGGERGVQEITRIATESGRVLKSGGWLFMEIGSDQQKEVFDIFTGTAEYESIAFYKDYAGLPRVFQARKR